MGIKTRILTTTATLAASAALCLPAAADEVKIGVVTFLSGGAAGPFGVPARNAAELVIDAINQGNLPAPYNNVGLAGDTIAPIYVDENSKQKNADFQKLVEKDGVELVLGYISSSSCKAIAPEAEKLKKLTVLFDCGTPQIFEEIVTNPEYTFRTAATATMDNVAAARYLMDTGSSADRVAGINQNYAWGQDSWRDFSASLAQLSKEAKIVTEQYPKVYAGQYGSEISAILTKRPDVVHSSFWGGDMEAFVIQGSARGVFERSRVVLTAGETAMHSLAEQIPNGTIIGARGPHGDLAPESALNDWFRAAYQEKFGSLPTYPSYKMAQALLGLKSAADKAGSSAQADIISALAGLEWEGPSGTVSMALAGGHQAIQDTAYGTFKLTEDGKGSLVDIIRYDATCVNPPEGKISIDWINAGFDGASCN